MQSENGRSDGLVIQTGRLCSENYCFFLHYDSLQRYVVIISKQTIVLSLQNSFLNTYVSLAR